MRRTFNDNTNRSGVFDKKGFNGGQNEKALNKSAALTKSDSATVFLETGKRKDSYEDVRARPNLPSATERTMRLNVYPDGQPRSGVFADLENEKAQNQDFRDLTNGIIAPLTDMTNLLKNGIPMKLPGMSDDDFKALLAEQIKSAGIQQKLFGEQKDKEQAAADAEARQADLLDLLQSGNFNQTELVEELKTMNLKGEVTNEQLNSLIELTAKLSGAKTEAERKAINDEIMLKSQGAVQSAIKSRMLKDIDDLKNSMKSELGDLNSNEFAGTPVEIKGDSIIVQDSLDIQNAESWINLFKIRSGDPKADIQFEGNTLNLTQQILEKASAATGVGGAKKNRDRLVLHGILRFIEDVGENPTFQEVYIMEKAATKFNNFSIKNRVATMDKFYKEVFDEFYSSGTPSKSASFMKSRSMAPAKAKTPPSPLSPSSPPAKAPPAKASPPAAPSPPAKASPPAAPAAPPAPAVKGKAPAPSVKGKAPARKKSA